MVSAALLGSKFQDAVNSNVYEYICLWKFLILNNDCLLIFFSYRVLQHAFDVTTNSSVAVRATARRNRHAGLENRFVLPVCHCSLSVRRYLHGTSGLGALLWCVIYCFNNR